MPLEMVTTALLCLVPCFCTMVFLWMQIIALRGDVGRQGDRHDGAALLIKESEARTLEILAQHEKLVASVRAVENDANRAMLRADSVQESLLAQMNKWNSREREVRSREAKEAKEKEKEATQEEIDFGEKISAGTFANMPGHAVATAEPIPQRRKFGMFKY